MAEITPRARPQEPPQEAPRTVTLADARVTQPSVSRYYLVPSYTNGPNGQAEAIELLTHLLGRGPNSRFYQKLVVEKDIAVAAGASYSGTAIDQTRLSVYGSPKPGHSLAEVETAIDATISELVENGITQPELERARNRAIADYVYAQDNQITMARWYGASLTTGLS